jgi:hypothetical protein
MRPIRAPVVLLTLASAVAVVGMPPPANRSEEFAVATYNMENLYDFRDDPFDGCDFRPIRNDD